jgi:hypothetical protein
VLADESVTAALRICEQRRRGAEQGEPRYWFSRGCLLDALDRPAGMDNASAERLLDDWVAAHGDYTDLPGVGRDHDGPLPLFRYVVLTETEYKSLSPSR